jgi:hypothetical protein
LTFIAFLVNLAAWRENQNQEANMNSIQLFKQNPETLQRELLGQITEAQLQFLIDHLEEEFTEDNDYYIDQDTVDFLKGQGADTGVIRLLEQAVAGLGPEEGVDIVYRR